MTWLASSNLEENEKEKEGWTHVDMPIFNAKN